MIAGVVLAAGRSTRMGSPKALLPLEGQPLVERWTRALREGGCQPVLVVVAPGEAGEAVARAAAGADGVVVNPRADSEQIDSIRAALHALPPQVEGVVVAPVDVAGQSAGAVRALLEGWREGGASIVVPTHRGERGHPTLFARAVFPELLADPLPEGARTVVHAAPDRVREVAVDEPGTVRDLNTPEEYRRRVEGR